MTSKKEEKQTIGLHLKKGSDSEQIRNYFLKIYELNQTGKKFPVDLDEVWPLIYQNRDKAYICLKSDFVENVDYQTFYPRGEKASNRPKVKYYLTVACLEYFIAKKRREVFEVYRMVFHKTIEQQQYLKDYERPKFQRPGLVKIYGITPPTQEQQHDADYLAIINAILDVMHGERRVNRKRELIKKATKIAIEIYNYDKRKEALELINKGGAL